MTRQNHDPNALSSSTRREFCTHLVLTSAGVMLVAPGAGRVLAAQESVVAYPPRKIEGAETLLPGSNLYFNYPTRNDPAILLRSNEGEFRAYSRRCSHAGCSVNFHGPSRCLRCPCHQGVYETGTGHVLYGPPQRPLDEIVLQVRAGGYVWAVGKSFGRNEEVITQTLAGGD